MIPVAEMFSAKFTATSSFLCIKGDMFQKGLEGWLCMYQWKVRDVEEKLWEIEGDSPNPVCTEGDITLWAGGIVVHHLLPLPCTCNAQHGEL